MGMGSSTPGVVQGGPAERLMMGEPEHSWGFRFSLIRAGGGSGSMVLL